MPSPPCAQTEVAGSWERLRKSCDSCQEAKVKCSQHKPSCHRCLRNRQPCVYSPQRRTGRPRKRPTLAYPTASTGSNLDGRTIGEATSSAVNGQDIVMPDVCGNGPHLLPSDITVDSINPINGIFQSSFEALLAASPLSKDPTGRDINPDVPHTGYLAASPASSDLFGDLSLFLPDFNIPHLPHPVHALDVEQLPPLSVGASNTSSECGDCGAKCYTMLLQALLFLRQSLPETTHPSIDLILQVDRQVRSLLDLILGCSTCLSNRSSVLLLSVITERVVQMLDWIIEEKTVLDTESARSTSRTSRPPQAGNRTGGRMYICRVPLLVGDIELDEDIKHCFFKQLILMRMKKLAVKLQEVRHATNARPGDCIYRAAELVLAESLQRLDYLRGQVQLWD